MTKITEKQDIQNQLIHFVQGIAWRYLPPDDVVGKQCAEGKAGA